MKIPRKPWINILRKLAKLFPSSKIQILHSQGSIYVREPHVFIRLPVPKDTKLPEGAIGVFHMLRALTPLSEGQTQVSQPQDNMLQFSENSVRIDVPFDTGFTLPKEIALSSKQVVARELPLKLNVLRECMGGVKATGVADFIYWEGSNLYAFNGAVLAIAEFVPCPVPRVLFPRPIAEFIADIVDKTQICTINIGDAVVECDFGELGRICFGQPDTAAVDWKALTPELPERWFGVPALFFRMPQIVMSLSDRHHSRVRLSWKGKKLLATSTEDFALPFALDDVMPYMNEREGYVDTVALTPILGYAQAMNWNRDCLVFQSHVFKFFVMLEQI